ncbi:MAG: Amuc_1100 family pilus-like protein [Akkermansiaceae bacterium]
MNWFKENKFLGVLLIVTLVLAGLVIFIGMKTSSSAADELGAAEQHISDNAAARALVPFPTAENVDDKKKNVKAMIAKAESAQSKFLAFRPETLENITVSTFADRLKTTDGNVRALFEEKGVRLSENAYLGFEQYKGATPLESATGTLAYELGAIEWLFTEAANAGVTEVSNFRRDELAIEKAAPVSSGKKKKKSKSKAKSKGSRSKRSGPALVKVAEKLPMSITLKGSEKSIRQTIEAIANSDQYFFEARVGRVKNPAPVPTTSGIALKKPAEVAAPAPASDDGFGVIEEEPAEEAPAAGGDAPAQRILNRVAGGEDVSVFLKLDLLIFDEETTFPVIK